MRNFLRSKHYLNKASFWVVIPCRLVEMYQISKKPLVFFFYSEYGWRRVSIKPEISKRLDAVTSQKTLSFTVTHVSTSTLTRKPFRRNLRHPDVSYHSGNYETSRLNVTRNYSKWNWQKLFISLTVGTSSSAKNTTNRRTTAPIIFNY
jgi:hypothetical protein